MELVDVAPGRATIRMTVRDDMVNGHGIGHGGFTFSLADSAFAFACNTYNRRTVAQAAEIALPGTHPARRRADRGGGGTDREGRDGTYDVTGPQRGCGGRRVRRSQQGDPGVVLRRRSAVTFRMPDTTPEQLHAFQLDHLRDTLNRVYEHVPHYRHAFDQRGVKPADLETTADLARFPFTTKEDLRQNYPYGMFAVPRHKVSRIHASSGTTGKPTVVGYTRDDLDTWSELVARSIHAAGGRPGDAVHVAYGYGLFTGGLGAHYGAERLGCTVIPVSGGMTERQVQLIVDFQPRIIMVTPSYFLAILDEMEAAGRSTPATPAWRSASSAPSRGPTRCARGGAAQRHRRGRHLRAVRGDGARRLPGVGDHQGRAARVGGPLLPRGDRPGQPSRCCPTARRASWCSPASPSRRCR